jgi:leader peptidase (prepilin peptidase)/N-methyltransferase
MTAPPLPYWFWTATAFLFGSAVGSFLNVVVVRLPRGESIIHPGSHCMSCGASVKALDNIPIFSFLILNGRCRNCGAAFSPRYALVELASALLAVACLREFGPGLAAVGFYVFVVLLLAISLIDLEHWIIPHSLSWTGIGLGLIFSFFNPRARPLASVLGALLGWATFTLVALLGQWLLKREALGLGDRWLLAMEGAFLGAGMLLPIVFLASLQGSVVGLTLRAFGRSFARSSSPPAPVVDSSTGSSTDATTEEWVPPKNAVPFGPFLALAAAELLFFGPAWLSAYQSLWLGRLG